ncbi:hypothetical protein [Mucilaginibacter jinjuensis]|uniref:Uncharacterized protein n=1 Tax=Mucilaginibacter jinjuensis TaxID=1176721 RepID=A0ABY7TCX0_9SPHI|nr:hypothetical protein [Mucilaginibacter jinjuensis]WCT14171.1 hypothetical protein PQO05_09515 [Mucilaginibacter jinjuensis]
MKNINSLKRWVAIITLSMLSPACSHETKSKTSVTDKDFNIEHRMPNIK